MMNVEHDRGDAPRRIVFQRDGMGMRTGLALVSAVICFATADAESGEDAPPTAPPGRPIPTACAKCKVENETDAKFCKGCGASMATKAEDDDEPDDDDEPSSSRRPGALAQPPRGRVVASVGPDAAYAELAGVATSASVPVIKGGLAARVNLALHVMGAFDLTEPDRAAAAFDVAIQDAARVPGLEAKLKASDERTKLDLGMKIVALGIEGYPRSDVLEDIIEGDKRVGVRLTREYRRMSVSALDEKHRRLRARAPARRETPFEPDPKRAADAAANGGLDMAARLEAAKKSPAAQRMLAAPNNTRTIEQIAEALVRNDDAARGASAGGAT
jgi:hypothetical protein